MIDETAVAASLMTLEGKQALKLAMEKAIGTDYLPETPEELASSAERKAEMLARFEASGYTREQLRASPELIREVFGPKPRP